MKQFIRLLLFLLFPLVVYNCNGDDNITVSIVGKWKLVQQLADPGDGSGRFRDVSSNKTITFLNDTTFTSNGDFCFMTLSSENSSSGTYLSDDNKIIVNTCKNLAGTVLNYKIEKSSLIIYYPCFEGCAEKFVKIE